MKARESTHESAPEGANEDPHERSLCERSTKQFHESVCGSPRSCLRKNVHREIKGRLRKRLVLYPRSGFSCERALVPVFVPGAHPPKPPLWKPPFWVPPKNVHSSAQISHVLFSHVLYLGHGFFLATVPFFIGRSKTSQRIRDRSATGYNITSNATVLVK